MAITAEVFTLALSKAGIVSGGLWTTGYVADDVRVILLNSTGAAAVITNRDTYGAYSDVSGNELAAAGNYTVGGVALGTKSIGSVIATHKVPYLAAASVWTSASFSAYGAVVYNNTPAGKPLLASVDFGGVQTVSAGTFTITWDATNGVFALAAS